MKKLLSAIVLALLWVSPVFAQDFPSTVTDTANLPYVGDQLQISTTLTSGVASGTACSVGSPCTVSVASTTGFANAGVFVVGASGDREVMRYTSKTSTTFNVVERSLDGASARTHDIGDVVFVDIPNVLIDRMIDEIIAIETELGVDPAGASATVAARFGGFDADVFSNAAKFSDGIAAAPGIALSGDTDSGLYEWSSNAGMAFSNGGTAVMAFNSAGPRVASSLPLVWGSSTFASPDLYLYRDAANTLALKNGGTSASPVPQTVRIYNYEDGANSEYGAIYWSSNVFRLGTFSSGTGSDRNVGIHVAGSLRYQAGTTAFFPHADNTYNLGGASFRWADTQTVTLTTGGLLTAHSIRVGTGSTPDVTLGADDVFVEGTLEVDGAARFDTSISLGADVLLYRDAANTLAQRNGGTNASPVPQQFRLYNFYAGASDYEFGRIQMSGAEMFLSTVAAGTGSAGDIYMAPGNSNTWRFQTSGRLIAATDNANDIGDSGNGRPRTGYFGTALVVGTNPATVGAVRLANNTYIYARNSTNAANIFLLGTNTSNQILFGGADVVPNVDASYAFGSSAARWTQLHLSSYAAIGTNPASAGAVRIASEAEIRARNAANSADITLIKANSSDRVELAASGQAVTMPTALLIGTNPASAGAVRIANLGVVTARNAANSANINLLYLDGSNQVVVGQNTSASVRSANHFYPITDATYNLGTTTTRWVQAYFSGQIGIGTNPATTGFLRSANAAYWYARNAGNTANVLVAGINGSDDILVGNSDEKLVRLTSVKATTGDPTGREGAIYINTFDNAIKMYADGAWRTLVTW